MPVQKKNIVVWIANEVDMEKLPSGLYRPESIVFNEIVKLREGVIVEEGIESFENFAIKPKKGDLISFKGYSGEIYQEGHDFYRIFEDKFVVAIVNKK